MSSLTTLLSVSTLWAVTHRDWTAADLPDFTGRTVVVTGANSGLGFEASRQLARVGARVVMAVRDPKRGEVAAESLSGVLEVRRLDLADLSSVRGFADGGDRRGADLARGPSRGLALTGARNDRRD